ncbi:lipopolysaccharide biosynthesis protein [Nevskia sp.]|uniref:lipopolysaccharide biosynthesis protein n=1 Tax=Nevskia sp. TaxID=1929292 RepID=UPI003F726A91
MRTIGRKPLPVSVGIRGIHKKITTTAIEIAQYGNPDLIRLSSLGCARASVFPACRRARILRTRPIRTLISPSTKDALRRLASRYASFAAARIALVIGRWFVLIQAARHLSIAEFAALAATLSGVELLRAVADLGTDSYIYSRLGSGHQALRATVRAALVLRGAASLLLSVGGIALAFLLTDTRATLPIFLLIVATAAQSSAVALLQKAERFSGLGVLVGITLAASLLVDLFVLMTPARLSTMAWLLITPDCIAGLSAVMIASAPMRALLQATGRHWRRLGHALRLIAGKLIPSALIAVTVMAYSRLDVVIVRPIAGIDAQADYSAGFRLIEPFFMLFALASLALLAELGSRRNADTVQLARRLLAAPVWPTVIGMVLAVMALGALARLVTQLLNLRPEAGLLAALFAAAIPFRVANSMITALLLRLGRFDAVMYAAVINSVITFSLAVLLTQRFGAAGAGAAALTGEICNTLFQRHRLQRQTATESLQPAS